MVLRWLDVDFAVYNQSRNNILTITNIWCGREDLNFHGFYPTTTSTLRVYQFRHDRNLLKFTLKLTYLQLN